MRTPARTGNARPLVHAVPVALATVLFASGCHRTEDDAAVPTTPKAAASRMESAFANAAPEVHQAATAAAESMRSGDYEKAVVSLQVVRSAPRITLDQGLAIHGTTVALESKLAEAAASGDAAAKRAYELLKASKRK